MRGRFAESAAIDSLLRVTRAGRSAALVVRGEAGIGKTALLEYAVESTSGFRVARAKAVHLVDRRLAARPPPRCCLVAARLRCDGRGAQALMKLSRSVLKVSL